MKLTNKKNDSFFWRESGNRLFVEIDGQPYELKFTVAQHEAYQDYLDDVKAKDDQKSEEALDQAAFIKRIITTSIDSSLRILEIAFNPKRDEKTFDIEKLKEIFEENLDLMQIVARTWIEKKLLNPSLSAHLDPQLAPAVRGA